MNLSVVIPVGRTDESWKSLVPSLAALAPGDEVLFVSRNESLRKLEGDPRLKHLKLVLLDSEEGRAAQLNRGADAAQHELLWFVHSDSQFTVEAVLALREALARDPDALYFFDLKFQDDGPRLMRLTEFGVLFRSRILRIPFGDQAFALSRETRRRLGPFDESAAYGEDHLFVWAAHREGVRLRALGQSLATSARKYRSKGWLRTTALHLRLTVLQALPNIWPALRKGSRP